MKKFLLFPLLVFMTAIIIPACSDDEEDIFSPETGDTIINSGDSIINGGDTVDNINLPRKFNGTLVVNESYVQDSTNCEIIIDRNNIALNIYNVKFAEAMPGSINLTVPEIPYEGTGGKEIVFAGDSLVPLMSTSMGTMPVPAYMFEHIEGGIRNRLLNFSATIVGRGTFTFNGNEVKMDF